QQSRLGNPNRLIPMPAKQHQSIKPDILITPSTHTHKVDKLYRNTPRYRSAIITRSAWLKYRGCICVYGLTPGGSLGSGRRAGSMPPVACKRRFISLLYVFAAGPAGTKLKRRA